jgi:hypothetical protein
MRTYEKCYSLYRESLEANREIFKKMGEKEKPSPGQTS